jgi:hypothetical protein
MNPFVAEDGEKAWANFTSVMRSVLRLPKGYAKMPTSARGFKRLRKKKPPPSVDRMMELAIKSRR